MFRSVLGPLLILLCTHSVLENKLIGFADDSTLKAVGQSPCVRVELVVSSVTFGE